MMQRSIGICGSMVVFLMLGLFAVPFADAHGGRGGGGGHQSRRPPRVSASHAMNRSNAQRSSRMPRASTPSHSNANVMRSNNAQVHANNASVRSNNAQARLNPTANTINRTSAGSSANSLGSTGVNTRTNAANRSNITSPNAYTYGTGQNARNYRAYGYGSNYRNRYSGGRSGYGRSQGNSMGIVSRLRSVHSTLSRIDHDYRGHRARAVHEISMAIRQLSHRSMLYNNSGFNGGANNTRQVAGNGNRNNGGAANGRANNGNRPTMHLSQAQSDAIMSRAMRTTQGISMQLSNQGQNTSGHSRARGHLQSATREMGNALSIR